MLARQMLIYYFATSLLFYAYLIFQVESWFFFGPVITSDYYASYVAGIAGMNYHTQLAG
jgi:hypothetical protein